MILDIILKGVKDEKLIFFCHQKEVQIYEAGGQKMSIYFIIFILNTKGVKDEGLLFILSSQGHLIVAWCQVE